MTSKNVPDTFSSPQQWRFEEVLQRIQLAEIRTLSAHDLVARAERIRRDPNPDEVLMTLSSLNPDLEDEQSLLQVLQLLAEAGDVVPSKARARIDRRLRHAVETMPRVIALRFAQSQMEHPRVARRELADRVFVRMGVDAELAEYFRNLYEVTQDEEHLHMIVRSPRQAVAIGHQYLLEHIRDEYWRMRVVECLLIEDPKTACDLAESYPFEFTHAAGRQQDRSALPTIRRILAQHTDSIEYISLYSWAMEQMQAYHEICRLSALLTPFVTK
jgi:hypothetical protein